MSDASNDAIRALPPLRDVIRDAGLQATKALGQNFLLDLNLTSSIATLNGDLHGHDIIEIGPGPGGLTRGLLLAGARRVHAIEFDARAVAALQPLVAASGGRLHLHQGDALDMDLHMIGDAPRAVIANLPYNVATPLLIGMLRHARDFAFMLLMFQKEVADRIVARPGSKVYGRLSVMAQWLCQVRVAKTLPPAAFTPPPKVHSSVVLFRPRADGGAPRFETMETILAAAFNQRRKMLRSSLKAYAHLLAQAGIDETMRAEDVAPESYIRLAHIVEGA